MRGWPQPLAPRDCVLEGSPPLIDFVPEEGVLHAGLLMVARGGFNRSMQQSPPVYQRGVTYSSVLRDREFRRCATWSRSACV